MKICENGHSYDETQFATCPICYAQGLTGASSGASQDVVRDENGGYYDAEGNLILTNRYNQDRESLPTNNP